MRAERENSERDLVILCKCALHLDKRLPPSTLPVHHLYGSFQYAHLSCLLSTVSRSIRNSRPHTSTDFMSRPMVPAHERIIHRLEIRRVETGYEVLFRIASCSRISYWTFKVVWEAKICAEGSELLVLCKYGEHIDVGVGRWGEGIYRCREFDRWLFAISVERLNNLYLVR